MENDNSYYFYFVSYLFNSTNGGSGFTEVRLDKPITDISALKGIAKVAEDTGNIGGVTILNFQLLRTEPIPVITPDIS